MGDRFFVIENPRRGGGKAGRGRGAGRSAANWGIVLGGGLTIFSGPTCSPRSHLTFNLNCLESILMKFFDLQGP